jgi:alkanesulfonate monooxygenase SsuD/methylene tetrahydromethanopterin reductase-like flavin-dependent oxidoreductase (luciferase family)
MVTTLDIVSKGRAVLGIGAAWYEPEHDGFGFEFPAVRERMDRLEEAVQICRALFREPTPTFTGRYYKVDKAHNVPRPLRDGGPRIMIGGSGERRTLRLVAQYADLCNISGGAETVRHKLEVLRGHCRDVGRDPREITTTRLGTLVLTPNADETARVTEFLRGIAGDGFDEQFTVGQEPDVIEQVGALVDAGVNELIFNLPMSDVATVQRAGELLSGRFG